MNRPLTGEALARRTAKLADEKKALDIVIVDLSAQSAPADWLVICEGYNPAHTRAVADHIRRELKKTGSMPWLREGEQDGRWILIDYTDVALHIFIPELRGYYDLESLWVHAAITRFPEDQSDDR